MKPTSDPAKPLADRLLGVVLCGGFSRRMGRDKGLIESGGITWAERMGRKLEPFGMPVVFSIRADQADPYHRILPEEALIPDALPVAGPLNGLFSAHQRFQDLDILLLACDMQDLDEGTIRELIEVYVLESATGRGGGHECYAYFDGEFAQPFCAVYTAAGLDRLQHEMEGERRMRALIGKSKLKRLEIKEARAFNNYNSQGS